MTSTHLAVDARGLGRRFGDTVAVDALDLQVRRGEVLGFLGPNGAGKTTTIRLLAGLVAPTAGAATVVGHDVVGAPAEVRRRVGILTETPGLYERLDVHQNLLLFARLYGVPDPRRAVQVWLERVGLWDRRDAAAGSLSKGMRQKVALCRALLHDPELVFLDEPTSALDPEASGMVRELVADLRTQGRTVFLTTHHLEEADRLCDRIAVFRTRLRVLDTAANLRERLFGRQLTVTVRGAGDAHEALLRGVPGVIELARDGDRLLMRVDDPDVVAPRVVRVLVGADADVLRISEVRQPLERVYLELLA
jgi:ABC-2 type transport system ATP-binding protein